MENPHPLVIYTSSLTSPAHIFETFLRFRVYNQYQLRLILTQLKFGTANQRHPFSSAAILLSTNQEKEKGNIKWQNKEQ